jgi:hypothetical protein
MTANLLWQQSRFPIPNIPLAFYDNAWYMTISDIYSVYQFVSIDKHVYVGVGFKCIPTPPENPTYYLISEPGALHTISCDKANVYDALQTWATTSQIVEATLGQ